MAIVLVGLNHKTAPVEVREQLAFTDEACADSLRVLVDGEVVREGFIVSPCNRVEVLAAAAGQRGAEAAERLSDFLGKVRSIPVESFGGHLYTHADEAAGGRGATKPPGVRSVSPAKPRTPPAESFGGHLYTHADEAAVRHVFRVA